ncbi:MAG: FecR domain-containing protein [Rhodothermales bacterium]|nr:FecR domain-containing protein [Rhodothermales bacterium]MBO6780212.1 FecR domain-containing protein [Rhodothermales bacterium]
MADLDRLIADAAREDRAESFGPYFAERTVRAAREAGLGTAADSALVGSGARAVRRSALRGSRASAARGTASSGTALPWLRPALAVATLALLITTADQFRTRTVSVAAGATEQVTLPDGTGVTLAAGSRIAWKPFLLRSERQVQLQGEAFFGVAHGERTFAVETFNARVVVTGTRFNVRAWPAAERPETLVSLEEGGVRVEASGSAETLVPGETVRIAADRIAREERLTPAQASGWRTGGIALVDLPLRDALASLERRFDVSLSAAASVSDRPTTYVAPSAGELEDVLDAICFALNLTYRPVLGGYTIEPAQ